MGEKQANLLDAMERLKFDIQKSKEKSAQQKAEIRNLNQVRKLSCTRMIKRITPLC